MRSPSISGGTRPRERLFSGAALLVTLALGVSAGCISPRVHAPEIVSGRAEWNNGYYNAILYLRNGTAEPVDLQDLQFELTVFDEEERVLVEGWAHRGKGEVEAWDHDRISLPWRDTRQRGAQSVVRMKDVDGNLLGEFRIDDAPHAEPPAAADASPAPPRLRPFGS